MSALSEEVFRELLDEHGVLRPHALVPPDRAGTYAVFAQRPDARLDVDTIKRQAEQFFATKLGVTVDKRYGDPPPEIDAARIIVSGGDGASSGTRLCYGRPASDQDRLAADEAERAQGTYGLSLLAHRCATIWLVVPEIDDDRVALTIAAILAMALLGPILPPTGGKIFGVRTARLELERRAGPYR